MPQPLFRGVLTALVTPFRDGAVDEAAFRSLVKRQIERGVHGLVPVGTTGETATLSHAEHKRVVELCIEEAAGRVPVIAGCGSNATAEAIDLMRHAKAVGAHGALVVTPYYNRPSQEGLYRHYAALNDAVELPILVYNVPSRTAGDISNETLARLAKLPNIVGVKDATGDLARASLMRLMCGEDFVMLSGDDPTALGYIAHGGHGCISVTSNVMPGSCAKMVEAALAGDFAGALVWQDKLIRLHKALFLDASPSPTKFALAKLGLCGEEVRLPLVPCADAVKPAILDALHAAGIEVPLS
ncbi:4-hydroxy-tetrahydrodipicolinate synthase [Caulobacter sp. S45]|uniref:4-hydroxy-tetrahydrodipicolinate synthase n=1 Tax=Caulobacter sp. S45 TaxID=1641861 RepID=UPI00131C9F17|nr:4-hydroxy-tetrahydrodipicolinate synthase [Caulobacter sp. S45]